ncbi:MAG TPA: CYTH domain-containing protein [Thermoanaerobaculia bacterium]|nr:CYTH domain-containing protein [Thermoanaerobaculia bacterium]
MGLEIERKFLVTDDSWKVLATGVPCRQGYLSSAPERNVRVRIAGEKGTLTVKGLNDGVTRAEFEYAIPAEDAAAMLDRLCEKPLIEKTRYRIPFGAHTWEVDEFHGENAGLVVAEVELRSADEKPARPAWVGREVSSDARYFNSNLAKRPFTTW